LESTENSNLSAVEDELAVVLIVCSHITNIDQLVEDLILRLDVEIVLTEFFEHSIEDTLHVVVVDVIKRSRAQKSNSTEF
jgi:hypothetical protein